MLRTIAVCVAVVVSAAGLGGRPARPLVYRNAEFGITLPVPRGAFLCPTPSGEHDQGPVLLLGAAGEEGCRGVEEVELHRYIEVFAGYNESYVTKTLPRLLRWDCRHLADGPCGAAPSGLRLAGLHSLAGMASGPHGWVYVIVETQAGKPDPDFDPSVPSINYSLTLHTTRKSLERDLRVFRRVLRTMRISPPDGR